MKKKIVFFHLLNNFTGSPLVLKNVIEVALEEGFEVELYTSKTKGFLTEIPGVIYYNNYYNRSNHRLLTLFSFFGSQLLLAFVTLFRYYKSNEIFYVNTILPFGSVLTGKILEKTVISHIHEYEIKPLALSNFLFSVVNRFSNEIIVVSEFLKNNPSLKRKDVKVIPNCVTEEFEVKAIPRIIPNTRFQVLMLASLRPYKGICEFIALSKILHRLDFRLVVSDTEEDLQNFLAETKIPYNLRIFPEQQDVHLFYQQADLILNLTDKKRCIETFGLTVLEGMYYGLPAIIPTVGGITELIEEGKNGFKIDSQNIEQLSSKIQEICENQGVYNSLHKNCLSKKEKFSRARFKQKIVKLLTI